MEATSRSWSESPEVAESFSFHHIPAALTAISSHTNLCNMTVMLSPQSSTKQHARAPACACIHAHKLQKPIKKKKKKTRRRKPAWRLKITGTEPPAARPHTQIRTSAGRNAHLSRRIWHQLVVICFRTSTVVVQAKTQRIHASVEVRRCHFYCLQHQQSSAILYPVRISSAELVVTLGKPARDESFTATSAAWEMSQRVTIVPAVIFWITNTRRVHFDRSCSKSFLRICFPLSQVSPTSLEENNGPTTNSKQRPSAGKKKAHF